MSKQIQKILLFFLISFSIYCAFTIGETWDESFHLNQGKVIIDYLFSFGKINQDILYRENYSAIYWSFSYLLTKQFPAGYQIEVSHLINLIFSLSTIVAIGKFSKELFNKKVANITFIILFFYPVFFGHMAINSKDTILAFSHVWMCYLILRYLKNQNLNKKTKKYVICLSVLAAIATGVQLVFLASLIPILLFFIIDIFFTKKIIKKNFSTKKLIFDLIKCFLFFYILLIFFWVDTHSNIISSPYNILIATFSESYWTGWPFNLVNGNFYLSSEIPRTYLLTNYIFKSPEYILISYFIFLLLFLIKKRFFLQNFIHFNYKISLIFFILIFPIIIFFLIPYPIYDGMRLFLWTIPYICLIPALTIHYFIENIKYTSSKIITLLLGFFFIYFLFNFFSFTPYHYTYLNILNGKTENGHNKFENDYWGASINELIKKTDFDKNDNILISTCGVNDVIVDYYFKKKGYVNLKIVPVNDSKYIIMTNRIIESNDKDEKLKLSTCFDKFVGDDLFSVKRNGLLLSVIRKI